MNHPHGESRRSSLKCYHGDEMMGMRNSTQVVLCVYVSVCHFGNTLVPKGCIRFHFFENLLFSVAPTPLSSSRYIYDVWCISQLFINGFLKWHVGLLIMPLTPIGSTSSFDNPIRSTELSIYETYFKPIGQLVPDNKWDSMLHLWWGVPAACPVVADVEKENLYACSSN